MAAAEAAEEREASQRFVDRVVNDGMLSEAQKQELIDSELNNNSNPAATENEDNKKRASAGASSSPPSARPRKAKVLRIPTLKQLAERRVASLVDVENVASLLTFAEQANGGGCGSAGGIGDDYGGAAAAAPDDESSPSRASGVGGSSAGGAGGR